MKTNRFTHLITAAFGLAAFSAVECVANDAATNTGTTVAPGPATTVQQIAVNPNVATAQWIDIEEYNYDMRAPFFAGLKQVEASVDDQIDELAARRAAMNSTTDTTDWDFAMKEMESARSYLRSTGEQLGKATPETWSQEKDKVGDAWQRTQEAYGKVKSSTTS
jgi:hypothetical protein